MEKLDLEAVKNGLWVRKTVMHYGRSMGLQTSSSVVSVKLLSIVNIPWVRKTAV